MIPYKLTDDRAALIIDAARQGHSRPVCAGAGGIAESTLCEWIRVGRLERSTGVPTPLGEFVTAIEMAELESERTAVDAWRKAFDTDWRAAAEWLARKFPERWARPESVMRIDADLHHHPGRTDAEALRQVVDDLKHWATLRQSEPTDPT